MTNMDKTKRVLVTTDFSDMSRQAFPYAGSLARRHQADLHVLHVVSDSELVFPSAYGVPPASRETLLHRSEEKLDQIGFGDTTWVKIVKTSRTARSVGEGIEAYADEIDADMIVIASHGFGLTGQVLLGSVTRHVARHAPCPVFCVTSKSAVRPVGDWEWAAHRILVPTDLSDRSADTVVVAVQVAQQHTAQLDLIHVMPLPLAAPMDEGGVALATATLPEVRERVEARMREMVTAAKPNGVPASVYIAEGSPAHHVVDMIDRLGTDLVVIGARRDEPKRRVWGGLIERLLHEATCPILIV